MVEPIIGQNIAYKGNPHVIIATKTQPLTENFLKNLDFKLKIADIEKIAKKELFVEEQFDFLIAEILHNNKNGYAVLGKIENVFYCDIFPPEKKD